MKNFTVRKAEETDKEAIFALRLEVFVKEQNVPLALEMDGHDAQAVHFLAEKEGMILGCARVIFSATDAHIGRLAVKRTYRNKGIGTALCSFVLNYCREQGAAGIWLSAQLHALPFYEALGFHAKGDTFTEAGIAHVHMVYGN